MSKQCPRLWEVEAVRDGRLRGDARDAWQLHVRHCADCTREQAALEQLATQLRHAAADGVDDMSARRLRQQVLAEANRALLQPSGDRQSRRWLRPSLGLAAVALLAAIAVRFDSRRGPGPTDDPLQLTAAKGARFLHERRRSLEYVELYEGSLDIRFDHRAKLGLVVRVPDGEVHDLGTTFRVSVARGHTSEVSVREGAVLLQRPGFDDVLLRAGEAFHAPAETAPPPPPSAANDDSSAQPAPRVHSQHPRSATPPSTKAPAIQRDAQAEDRSYLHVLELLHQGRADDARAAADAYLRAFPDGFRRPEVERIARRP